MSAEGDVSHADLLAEIKGFRADHAAFRADLDYLAEPGLKAFLRKFADPDFQGDALQGVEIVRTARVGGNGLAWLGKIAKPLLYLAGAWIAFKAGVAALAGFGLDGG